MPMWLQIVLWLTLECPWFWAGLLLACLEVTAHRWLPPVLVALAVCSIPDTFEED